MNLGMFSMFTLRDGASQAETFHEWLGLAELAEEAGLDTVWLGESHFRPQRAVLSSPLVVAAAVAARTRRIGIGIAVQVLPLANPVRIAEEAAIVDHLSKGRLIFGVGRSSFLESYAGYNVDYAESRPIFMECLEIIQRAWNQECFSYDGKYYQFHDVRLVPRPYQQPHPPMRMAVESRETFGIAGNLGLPIFIRYQLDVSELQQLLAEYQEARHAAGFPGPNDVNLQIPVYVAETREKALAEPRATTARALENRRRMLQGAADAEALDRLTRLSQESYEEMLKRTAYGTPEMVVERLLEFRETFRLTGFSLDFNPGGQLPYELVVNSMRLMGERVKPKLP